MRKLALTVALLVTLYISGVTGQTAQARSSKSSMLTHPSYVVRGLLCIHSYEGSWTDPSGPYWGGLQMDLSFQKTYGWIKVDKHSSHVHKVYFLNKWGTADKWPIWAQLVTGIHAYFSRGFEPWPLSSHDCGLR